MGLAARLLNVGISVENTIGQVGVRTGLVPLQWPAGESGDSVIYRLPRDPHARASMLATSQSIVVNAGETAVVLEDGQVTGELEPGRYRFERPRVSGVLDVIWVKRGQRTVRWGVGNLTSADGIQVTSNGIAFARVSNCAQFLTEVVQGATTILETDLQRFVMPRIQSVVRGVMTQRSALELQSERAGFVAAIRSAIAQPLEAMGLELVDFEVVEVGLPAEFKAVVAGATMARHSGSAQLVQAEIDAKALQVGAAAAAQAELTTGMANLQLLAALQQHGVDPLRMKALEALQTFAETPSNGGLVSGDAFKAQLFGQVAGAALGGMPAYAAGNPIVPQLTAASTAGATDAPRGAGSDAAPAAGPSVAELRKQIDGLTARLAEGTLSEAMYVKLVAALEQRIEDAQRS